MAMAGLSGKRRLRQANDSEEPSPGLGVGSGNHPLMATARVGSGGENGWGCLDTIRGVAEVKGVVRTHLGAGFAEVQGRRVEAGVRDVNGKWLQLWGC